MQISLKLYHDGDYSCSDETYKTTPEESDYYLYKDIYLEDPSPKEVLKEMYILWSDFYKAFDSGRDYVKEYGEQTNTHFKILFEKYSSLKDKEVQIICKDIHKIFCNIISDSIASHSNINMQRCQWAYNTKMKKIEDLGFSCEAKLLGYGQYYGDFLITWGKEKQICCKNSNKTYKTLVFENEMAEDY